MTETNGSNEPGTHAELLRMFLTLAQAKEAIGHFEAGDINIHDAMEQLAMANRGFGAA